MTEKLVCFFIGLFITLILLPMVGALIASAVGGVCFVISVETLKKI